MNQISKEFINNLATETLAKRGCADSQFDLGLKHQVSKNYMEAYKWFSLAVVQGHEKAKAFLESVEREMTPDKITEAQECVALWQREQ